MVVLRQICLRGLHAVHGGGHNAPRVAGAFAHGVEPLEGALHVGFPENALNGGYPETKAVMEAYYAKAAEAKAEVTDIEKRYSLFAEAEAMLINNAIAIPYRGELADYQVTKIDVYEGEYAAFGICNYRFKYQHVQDEFVTAEQNEASKAAWLEQMQK